MTVITLVNLVVDSALLECKEILNISTRQLFYFFLISFFAFVNGSEVNAKKAYQPFSFSFPTTFFIYNFKIIFLLGDQWMLFKMNVER